MKTGDSVSSKEMYGILQMDEEKPQCSQKSLYMCNANVQKEVLLVLQNL